MLMLEVEHRETQSHQIRLVHRWSSDAAAHPWPVEKGCSRMRPDIAAAHEVRQFLNDPCQSSRRRSEGRERERGG